MKFSKEFSDKLTGKPTVKSVQPVIESKSTETTVAFSRVLNQDMHIVRKDDKIFLNGVPYSDAELALLKEVDKEWLPHLHLIKEVFQGTIGQEEDPIPYNPVSCRYNGGEERGVHPEACRWHISRNDKNCFSCLRFAAGRRSLTLNQKGGEENGRDPMAG